MGAGQTRGSPMAKPVYEYGRVPVQWIARIRAYKAILKFRVHPCQICHKVLACQDGDRKRMRGVFNRFY